MWFILAWGSYDWFISKVKKISVHHPVLKRRMKKNEALTKYPRCNFNCAISLILLSNFVAYKTAARKMYHKNLSLTKKKQNKKSNTRWRNFSRLRITLSISLNNHFRRLVCKKLQCVSDKAHKRVWTNSAKL